VLIQIIETYADHQYSDMSITKKMYSAFNIVPNCV